MADQLQVGWKIKDNDPRVNYPRVLTIIEVLPNGVVAEDRNRRVFTILRRRIYTDGKPRLNGFSLVMRASDGVDVGFSTQHESPEKFVSRADMEHAHAAAPSPTALLDLLADVRGYLARQDDDASTALYWRIDAMQKTLNASGVMGGHTDQGEKA